MKTRVRKSVENKGLNLFSEIDQQDRASAICCRPMSKSLYMPPVIIFVVTFGIEALVDMRIMDLLRIEAKPCTWYIWSAAIDTREIIYCVMTD